MRFVPSLPRTSPTALAAAVFALLMFCAVAGAALLPNNRAATAIVNAAAISNSSTTVGISDTDMYWESMDPAAIAKRLDAMQALGVQNIRIGIPWATVEVAPGQYNWTMIDNMVNAATARGMGVLGIINTTPTWARGTWTNVYAPPDNPANLGAFAGVLASRYAGKVSAYEVWNEPNAAFAYQPGPDPAGYTALLKAAYTAIKSSDPSAQVVGAVVGATQTWGSWTLNPVDFVQQMYAAGAKGYFDALSFHPYSWALPFSSGALIPNSPLDQANRIFQLMQANGDGTKKIWGTEYGVPTGVPGVGNQASMIEDFLNTWSKLSYAGPSFLYTLLDRNSADTWDPEATFGLFTDSWVAKAAAQVVKDFIAAHPQTPTTPTPPTTPAPPTNPFEAWAAAVQASVQAWLKSLADAIANAFAPAPQATTSAQTLAAAATTTTATTSTPAPTTTSSATTTPATTGEPMVAALAAPSTTPSATTSAPATTTVPPATTTSAPPVATATTPTTTAQTAAPTSSSTATSTVPTTTATTATSATTTTPSTAASSTPSSTSSAPTTQQTPETTAAR